MPLTKPRQALARSKLSAARRQARARVHGDRGRRLEVGAAHRGVDEQPDLRRVDAGLGDRLRPGHRRGVGEGDVVRPPAALADAGEALEHPGRMPEPLVRCGEPVVDLVRRHHDRRVDPADRQDGRVGVVESGGPVHASPLVACAPGGPVPARGRGVSPAVTPPAFPCARPSSVVVGRAAPRDCEVAGSAVGLERSRFVREPRAAGPP